MEAPPNLNARSTLRVPLLTGQQIKTLLGKDGLSALLRWIKRLVALVAWPFHAGARLLLPKLSAGATTPRGVENIALPDAGGQFANISGMQQMPDAVAASLDAGKPQTLEAGIEPMAQALEAIPEEERQIAVELEGFPPALATLRDALLAHVDAMLVAPKAFHHNPEDTERNKVIAKLFGQEIARLRYAQRLAIAHVGWLINSMLKDVRCTGLSQDTAMQYLRQLATDKARRTNVRAGSLDHQLLRAVDDVETLRQAYDLQMVASDAFLAALGDKADQRNALFDLMVAAETDSGKALEVAQVNVMSQLYTSNPSGERFTMHDDLFHVYGVKTLVESKDAHAKAPASQAGDVATPADTSVGTPAETPAATAGNEKEAKQLADTAIAGAAEAFPVAIKATMSSAPQPAVRSMFGTHAKLPELDASDFEDTDLGEPPSLMDADDNAPADRSGLIG